MTANLIVIFGPPASGKAAIGSELAKLTGYRFFHNHLTADPVAALFGWGTPQFGRMVGQVRDLLLQAAAADDAIPGVIFTFVWALDEAEDEDQMRSCARIFEERGGRVMFVELTASLQCRIDREGTPLRLALKPAQRDVQAARQRQVELDTRYRMNTAGKALPLPYAHFAIDTELCTPDAAARLVQQHLELPTVAGHG